MRVSTRPSCNRRMAASVRSQSRDSPASTRAHLTWSKRSSWTSQRPERQRQTPPTLKKTATANQTQRVQCRNSSERALGGVRGLMGKAGSLLDDLDGDGDRFQGIVAMIGFFGHDL